jgi:hypothetical protein
LGPGSRAQVELLSPPTALRTLEVGHLFGSASLATAAVDYTVDELLEVALPEAAGVAAAAAKAVAAAATAELLAVHTAQVGLGRIVAVCDRSSTLYHIY